MQQGEEADAQKLEIMEGGTTEDSNGREAGSEARYWATQ